MLWFIINIYLLFVPVYGTELLKPLEFLKSDKGVCYSQQTPFNHTQVQVKKVTFGKHQKMGAGCQEIQLCDWRAGTFNPGALTSPWGGEKGWRLNKSLIANDLINCAYIMNPHKTPKGGDLESFQVGEPECFHMPLCWVTNSMKTETPLLRTSYCVSSSAVDSCPL